MQGHTSHPELTALGRAQATDAARALADCGASRLLCSDLTRAWQTAAVIGRALGLEPQPTDLLREQGLGTLEGLTSEAAMAHYQTDSYRDPHWRPGGGESVSDVRRRVETLLRAEGPEPGQTVIWVTHADTIRVVLAALLGEDLTDLPWRAIANGEVITVRAADDSTAVWSTSIG